MPVYAERHEKSPWHKHHIVERYGLLTIIVLGETLLAASMALERSMDGEFGWALVRIALSAMAILFSMWWLYFAEEEHLSSRDSSQAFSWGYGHGLIYVSGAAVGAGFAALIDVATNHSAVSMLVGNYAVAIPIAVYFLGLWFVRDRRVLSGKAAFVIPFAAVAILVVPLFGGLEGIALCTMLGVVCRNRWA